MKVLQTPVRYVPFTGGVEAYVRDISTTMVKMGHEVTVICANVSSESESNETIDGVQVRRLRSVGQIANTNITPRLPDVVLRKARQSDVIHTHLPTPWSADWSAMAAVLTRTPLVVTYHNDIVGSGFANQVAALYNSTALHFTLGVADRILTTTEEYISSSNHLQSYQKKISVVQNGVDVGRFRPASVDPAEQSNIGFDVTKPTVFFLSVLDEYHEYKGLEVLLSAVARLAKMDGITPQLLIGGDGNKRKYYEDRAAEFGINEHVTFAGYIPEEDLVKSYNSADVFVLPSTSSDQEGFGLVALEALACGTPVITTDVVGVADSIREQSLGVVVSPNDVESLAKGIQTGINQVVGDRAIRQKCREFCENKYSWRSSVDELLVQYHEVLS